MSKTEIPEPPKEMVALLRSVRMVTQLEITRLALGHNRPKMAALIGSSCVKVSGIRDEHFEDLEHRQAQLNDELADALCEFLEVGSAELFGVGSQGADRSGDAAGVGRGPGGNEQVRRRLPRRHPPVARDELGDAPFPEVLDQVDGIPFVVPAELAELPAGLNYAQVSRERLDLFDTDD